MYSVFSPPDFGATQPSITRFTPRSSAKMTRADLESSQGYVGRDMIMPFKKTKGQLLFDWQKTFNGAINKTRAVVERVIANLKNWCSAHRLSAPTRHVHNGDLGRRRAAVLLAGANRRESLNAVYVLLGRQLISMLVCAISLVGRRIDIDLCGKVRDTARRARYVPLSSAAPPGRDGLFRWLALPIAISRNRFQRTRTRASHLLCPYPE
jgi:hypothetical protein